MTQSLVSFYPVAVSSLTYNFLRCKYEQGSGVGGFHRLAPDRLSSPHCILNPELSLRTTVSF